jgi:type III pantothenate kinase
MNPMMNTTCILDFGNTRVKWAVFNAGELQQVLSDEEAWRTLETWDEDAHWLIAATGVVDEQWQGWLDALKVRAPHAVHHLQSAEEIPLPMRYDSVSTLGLDRVANAAAVLAKDAESPWLVIDAGTCITADLVEGGAFCGGSIAPGIDLRLRAMFAGTATLPYPENWREQATGGVALHVGSDTEGSLLAGAIGGVQSELSERIRQFQNEFPGIRVAITGGDAKFLELQADLPTFADPNLTWTGYYHVLNRIITHD